MNNTLLTVCTLCLTAACTGTTSTKTDDSGYSYDTGTSTSTDDLCTDSRITHVINEGDIGSEGSLSVTISGASTDYANDAFHGSTLVICNKTTEDVYFIVPVEESAFGWSHDSVGEGCEMTPSILPLSVQSGIANINSLFESYESAFFIASGAAHTIGLFGRVDTSACDTYGASYPNDAVVSVPYSIGLEYPQ